MRVNCKALRAENKQLRAQLDAAKGVTRNSLIAHLNQMKANNLRLAEENGLSKGLPVNPVGVVLYGTGHAIVGDILVCEGIQGLK